MNRPRGAVGLVLALTLASIPTAAGQAAPGTVPETLAEPTLALEDGLDDLRGAEDINQAREIHQDRVGPHAQDVAPYLEDLVREDGRLLATYLDRIDQALEEGEASDARSLAGAAANLVEDEILPVAQRWDANRTAVMAGPLQASSDGLRVGLVLVNPPPGGIAAFDASLSFQTAAPLGASVELGQGETRIDDANATVRWASFDASTLARLSPQQAERVLLGDAELDQGPLEPGSTIVVEAHAHELRDSEGQPVPTIGVDAERTVPEAHEGASAAWWALGGVGVASVGLGWWIHRWEV